MTTIYRVQPHRVGHRHRRRPQPPPARRRGSTTASCIPNNVNLAGDRKLQRALEGWQPKFLDWWKNLGPVHPHPRRLPAHRDRGRPRRLGALRPGADGVLPLGHLPGRARPRPDHRLRPAQGRAGLAGGARRVPLRPAPADRRPGRHRARVGRAAAPPGHDRAVAVRHAQPVPGQRRGGPAPVGDGLPAAGLLRPGRPRGGRAAAQAELRRLRLARASSAPSTRRPPTGCRSSCSPTSPTGTASTSSAR